MIIEVNNSARLYAVRKGNVMYTDKMSFECVQHSLKFEYPRKWADLHLPAPRCSVCATEESEKWQGRFDEMKTQRDKLVSVIEIKNNIEVESV